MFTEQMLGFELNDGVGDLLGTKLGSLEGVMLALGFSDGSMEGS